MTTRFWTGRLPLGAASLLLAGSLALTHGVQSRPDETPLDSESWDLFRRVFGMILKDYVDPKAPREIIRGALQGAAAAAGPESAYISPEEVAAYRSLGASTGSLPLYVTKGEDFARILAVYPGSPETLRPGTILRFIGSASTYDLTYPQVLSALRGKPGEAVSVTLMDPETWQSQTLSVTRQAPLPPRVLGLPGGAAALVLPCLEAAPSDAVLQALAKATGPVLVDLRQCASCDGAAAARWAGVLLGPGRGPRFKGPGGGERREETTGPGVLAGKKIRVLVDGSTARAGEALAAALVEAGGLLVGQPTYGTAARVEEFPLSDGGLLRMATAYYLAADGTLLEDKPMHPALALTPAPGEPLERIYAAALKAPPAPERPQDGHPKPGT
ncbi:MAG: S41 family peptidase [Acidobacteriota bacterium]